MIAKGNTVFGSAQSLTYILNDRECAVELERHLLFGESPQEMFQEMCKTVELNPNMKRPFLSCFFSPSGEYTTFWTLDDWQRLKDEIVSRLGLNDNQYLCALHTSKPHHPHLHFYFCRADFFTGKNRVTAARISLQCQKIAADICRERGWMTAKEVSKMNAGRMTPEKENIKRVLQECIKQSSNMQQFDEAMRKQGYFLKWKTRDDSIIGLRIIPVSENNNNSGLKTLPGFKLSEVDRGLKVRDILLQLNAKDVKMLHKQSTSIQEELTPDIMMMDITPQIAFSNDPDDDDLLLSKKKKRKTNKNQLTM
jgi:hypothetical protein